MEIQDPGEQSQVIGVCVAGHEEQDRGHEEHDSGHEEHDRCHKEEQKGGKEPEYSLSQPRVVMQWEWPWIYKEPNRGDFWVLIKSQR